MSPEMELQKNLLAADLRAIIADAQALLQVGADAAGDAASAAREGLQQRLLRVRDEIGQAEAAALHRARTAARLTDGYVRTNPWATAGLAAGVGLLVGMLISRR